MTVQQVIETEIPNISRTGYQVYQFPSRALLNPEKDASVLQDQEISIEPMRFRSPGSTFSVCVHVSYVYVFVCMCCVGIDVLHVCLTLCKCVYYACACVCLLVWFM